MNTLPKKQTAKGFDTRAVHSGKAHDYPVQAIITPIFATSSYEHDTPGIFNGEEFMRNYNPTRFAFERAIASLEGAKSAFAYASGLAATSAIMDLLEKDSHILMSDDVSGIIYRLMEHVRLRASGTAVSYVDLTDAATITDHIRPNTKLVWIETPTNPLLKLVDIAAVAEIAHQHGLLVVVDNTLASPWIQTPLSLGADIVMHSATKYIGGHSDVVGGVVVTSRSDLVKQLAYQHNAVGAEASPFDSFLMHRGLKTLGLRMERHCTNALFLAQWLERHEKVESVIYPGLPSHPQHKLVKTQMHGKGGGIISIVLKGGRKAADRLFSRMHIFTLSESLGGVESSVEYPAAMTYASIPADIREKIGIKDGLVRLSIGIEDITDLQEDLAQALN